MGYEPSRARFRKPDRFARLLNKAFGALLGHGIGLRHNYLLEVRGRKRDRVYSTPVDLLEFKGRRLLVAPRGRTQWVRNAEAAGQVALKRGVEGRKFHTRIVSDDENRRSSRSIWTASN